VIALWILHRSAASGGPPERFDPSRFMPDAAPPPRFAYMPVGAGLRICVGGRFALTELVLVVAKPGADVPNRLAATQTGGTF
jgi:cytochrome P450